MLAGNFHFGKPRHFPALAARMGLTRRLKRPHSSRPEPSGHGALPVLFVTSRFTWWHADGIGKSADHGNARGMLTIPSRTSSSALERCANERSSRVKGDRD